MTPPKKPLSGRQRFLLLVVAVYAVAGLFAPALVGEALRGFARMAIGIVPMLLLVFGILWAVNLLLDPARVRRYLGPEAGRAGWLYAVAGSIVVAGPPYVLYPMLAELKEKGARTGLIAAFLFNRNVKIHFLPVMLYYFGLRYTAVLSFFILLFALANGWLMERLLAGRDGW